MAVIGRYVTEAEDTHREVGRQGRGDGGAGEIDDKTLSPVMLDLDGFDEIEAKEEGAFKADGIRPKMERHVRAAAPKVPFVAARTSESPPASDVEKLHDGAG